MDPSGCNFSQAMVVLRAMTLRHLLRALAATGGLAGAAGLGAHVIQARSDGRTIEKALGSSDGGPFDGDGGAAWPLQIAAGGARDAGIAGPPWILASLESDWILSVGQLLRVDETGRILARLSSRKNLVRAMGPIDTPQKALAALVLEGLTPAAEKGVPVRSVSGGFEVKLTIWEGECPLIEVESLYGVDAEGRVKYLEELRRSRLGLCAGRLPSRVLALDVRRPSGLGEFFAQMGRLEALSVLAFEELAGQLTDWAAPPALIRKARRARLDEVRHAAVANGLAYRLGSSPIPIREAKLLPRTAFEVACHNAIEGCISETFGALLGLVQARTAEHLGVRRVMANIANDEVRHAQLAWEVARWLEPKLGRTERAEVAASRARALAALSHEGDCVDTGMAALVGLPVGDARRSLAGALERALA